MSHHYQRPAIIIVEDAADIRILVQRLIHDLTHDFDLIAVDASTKALEHLAHRTVPLLVTDYAMPGMDGLELTRRVKAASPATTIVMITAHESAKLRAQAAAAGAEHFLAKPFPLSQFEQLARAVLERWQAQRPRESAGS